VRADRGQRSDLSAVIYEQRLRHACAAAVNQSGTSPPARTSRLWYRAVLCDALVGVSQVPMIWNAGRLSHGWRRPSGRFN
jgi:hypothetical protein